MARISFVGVLLASCLFLSTAAADGWDEYQPSSFDSALAKTLCTFAVDICVIPGIPYRFEVTYTGKQRPIIESRKELVQHWLKFIGRLDGNEDLFSTEILVTESGKERWVPIQRQVLPYLDKEQPKGGPIDLYVVLVGAVSANSSAEDRVFVVNEFESLEPKKK